MAQPTVKPTSTSKLAVVLAAPPVLPSASFPASISATWYQAEKEEHIFSREALIWQARQPKSVSPATPS